MPGGLAIQHCLWFRSQSHHRCVTKEPQESCWGFLFLLHLSGCLEYALNLKREAEDAFVQQIFTTTKKWQTPTGRIPVFSLFGWLRHCPLAKPFFLWPCGSCSVKEQRMEFICLEGSLGPSSLPATQGSFILPARLPLGGLPYQGYVMGQMTSETSISSPSCGPCPLRSCDLVMCFHSLTQRPLQGYIRAVPTNQWRTELRAPRWKR